MRVVLISPYPLQQEYVTGGVEAVTSTLAPALARHPEIDHVHVLSYKNVKKVTKVSVTDDLTIWHYPEQKKFRTITRPVLEKRIVRQLVQEIKPDILHGEGIGLIGKLAISAGPEAIVTVHGVPYVEAQKVSAGNLADRVQAFLVKRYVFQVLQKAKVVISTTAYDKNLLQGLIKGTQVYIPNPVSSLFFLQGYHESKETYILFSGVMAPRKNILGILNAFASIAKDFSANLHITGPQSDPGYGEEVQKRIDELGIGERVKLLGFLSNEELAQQIKNSAMLVLFSWEETLPTIVAQTMAAGKPVVASNVGGVSEMITEGQNGFLVPPGDEAELGSCMRRLLMSPEMRKEMGASGFQAAREKFDVDQIVKKTVAVYQGLL